MWYRKTFSKVKIDAFSSVVYHYHNIIKWIYFYSITVVYYTHALLEKFNLFLLNTIWFVHKQKWKSYTIRHNPITVLQNSIKTTSRQGSNVPSSYLGLVNWVSFHFPLCISFSYILLLVMLQVTFSFYGCLV